MYSGVLDKHSANITRSDTPWVQVSVFKSLQIWHECRGVGPVANVEGVGPVANVEGWVLLLM